MKDGFPARQPGRAADRRPVRGRSRAGGAWDDWPQRTWGLVPGAWSPISREDGI